MKKIQQEDVAYSPGFTSMFFFGFFSMVCLIPNSFRPRKPFFKKSQLVKRENRNFSVTPSSAIISTQGQHKIVKYSAKVEL